jgi:hypothetical protein
MNLESNNFHLNIECRRLHHHLHLAETTVCLLAVAVGLPLRLKLLWLIEIEDPFIKLLSKNHA